MHFFDRKTSFWLVIIGIPLLFLPKINLINMGANETAGVRIDDMILLGIAVMIGWAHFILQKKLASFEYWVLIITVFSIFSFLMNRLFVVEEILHVRASLFYCLRLFEYFLFFYIGALSRQFFRTSSIVKAFFLWNMLLMILQRTGLIGQFTVLGYTSNLGDRVGGISSFPSEAGMLLNMFFVSCFMMKIKIDVSSIFVQNLYAYFFSIATYTGSS